MGIHRAGVRHDLLRRVVDAYHFGLYGTPSPARRLRLHRIAHSSLPGVQFGDFNSVLLVIIGVIANGSVALIALILVVVLAWNYLKLLLEASERYIVLGILVFTAPLAFAMGAARGTNNIFKSWCRMFSGQLLLLIMNAWCLKLFVNMVGEFLANPLSL